MKAHTFIKRQINFSLPQLCKFHFFIAGVASFKAIEGEGVKPDFVAGHSVGAFSAATFAGVIRFENALKIVKLRGD